MTAGTPPLIALVLALITLRMSGHYLPLATIAWALSLNFTIANMETLGKYDGLLGVPAIELFGLSLADGRAIYYLIWLFAILGAIAVRNLLDSRPGRAIRALGGATVMAESMGAASPSEILAIAPSGCSRRATYLEGSQTPLPLSIPEPPLRRSGR